MQEILTQEYAHFAEDLKQRVLSARYKAALSVNQELIALYHHIGSEILKSQKQHGWGAKVIDQLSQDLRSEFPEMKGFSTRNLTTRCIMALLSKPLPLLRFFDYHKFYSDQY